MSGRPSGRSESGTTLIELLVAVAIMGIAFVTIIGGIGTAIIGSGQQKRQASADVVLRTATEAITYQPCAATYTLPAAPGYNVAVGPVSYWNGVTNQFEASLPSSCPAADGGLQLMEVTVTSTGAGPSTTQSLQVVRRRP